MNDNDGFDGGDFLTGALFVLLLGQLSQARQAEQQRAAEQAAAERHIVHRGEAALRTAQQFGMTPRLHYEIAQADSVLRQWEQRQRDAEFAARTQPIRSTARWFGAVVVAALAGLLGIVAWLIAATVLGVDEGTTNASTWWFWAVTGGAWLWWAVQRHDAALQSLSQWERRWLHHHGGPWHAHEYAVLKHHHQP